MYYLSGKEFVPISILLSLFFVPVIIGSFIQFVKYLDLKMFLLFLILMFIYILLLLILYKILNIKKYYLLIEDKITIHYPNINKNNCIKLEKDEICYIEYYKLFSIRSWFLLFYNYVFPKAVFITYGKINKTKTIFIGYLNYKDIVDISRKIGIEPKIK